VASAAAQDERIEDRPLPEYAGLATAFWLLFGAFLTRKRDRLPERIAFGDLGRIALSTYKLSRLIAKDDVTSFMRAPVTEDAEGQEPKPEGAARAIGELLTCPYCIGLWIASGLSYGHVLFPRETRFATTIFSAHAIADFLNAGFVALREQNS
jgi:hypothetical protein